MISNYVTSDIKLFQMWAFLKIVKTCPKTLSPKTPLAQPQPSPNKI